MNVSDWLDEKQAEHADLSQIPLPQEIFYDSEPDEFLFFAEINPCGAFCKENHPFASVERFGHWFYARGQDKQAGIHSTEMNWRLFTRDKAQALQTAKALIEP